ncbi:MAG: polysaccharide deacetylase family protein [Planctomyces sp.]|nr:polysaccharide deacetylase family protein [Planctomyces sp.]
MRDAERGATVDHRLELNSGGAAGAESAIPQAAAWRRVLRHRLSHVWPRAASWWVPDLWIQLPRHVAPAGDRVAALTFDDGPTAAGTGRLLEVLARWNVPATFFLLGENIVRFPKEARAILDAGHAVGNHFRTHLDCWGAPRRAVVREVTEGGRIQEQVLGRIPPWCRPPYGRLTHTIVKWSRVHRQQIVLWDVFPPDSLEQTPPRTVEDMLLTRLRPRSIACLHDNEVSQERTPAALNSALPKLIDAGWRFVTLPPP